MQYNRAFLFFLIIGIIITALLLYFANITRKIEKENYKLSMKIKNINEQIDINEIEYSIYSSYDYLKKLRMIYFQNSLNKDFDNRLSFSEITNNSVEILKIGAK